MQPLIRNVCPHLGPPYLEEKVHMVRFMVLLFQVIVAENGMNLREIDFCKEVLFKVGPLRVSQGGLILVQPNSAPSLDQRGHH